MKHLFGGLTEIEAHPPTPTAPPVRNPEIEREITRWERAVDQLREACERLEGSAKRCRERHKISEALSLESELAGKRAELDLAKSRRSDAWFARDGVRITPAEPVIPRPPAGSVAALMEQNEELRQAELLVCRLERELNRRNTALAARRRAVEKFLERNPKFLEERRDTRTPLQIAESLAAEMLDSKIAVYRNKVAAERAEKVQFIVATQAEIAKTNELAAELREATRKRDELLSKLQGR
jgi:hypothetical protein